MIAYGSRCLLVKVVELSRGVRLRRPLAFLPAETRAAQAPTEFERERETLLNLRDEYLQWPIGKTDMEGGLAAYFAIERHIAGISVGGNGDALRLEVMYSRQTGKFSRMTCES
jgi:hypothetical protein